MKDEKDEMITIRVKRELMAKIVEWGRQEDGLPSKAEVVRRMVEYAAKHKGKKR